MSKICKKCSISYKETRQDKMYRKLISANSLLFPMLKDVVDRAKGYCPICYRNLVLPVAKDLAGV